MQLANAEPQFHRHSIASRSRGPLPLHSNAPYIAAMIPTLRLTDPTDRARAKALLDRLRLKPADVVLAQQQDVAAVNTILADVAARGDDAIVESARKFDDPGFTREQIKVSLEEMSAAHARIPEDQLSALRRS